jgi:hypothetical protein
MSQLMYETAHCVASQVRPVIGFSDVDGDQDGTIGLITAKHSGPHRGMEYLSFSMDKANSPRKDRVLDKKCHPCSLVPGLHGLPQTSTKINFTADGIRGRNWNRVIDPVGNTAVVQR